MEAIQAIQAGLAFFCQDLDNLWIHLLSLFSFTCEECQLF